MNLVFKARHINEIENETRKAFVNVIGDFSAKTVILFIKKGLGVDEAKAMDELDKYLEEGKTMTPKQTLMTLYLEIIKVLEDDGFLDPSLQMGKTLKDALNNPNYVLEKIGEAAKNQQS